MGYYITLEKSTFRIPAENLEEAFTRLKALNHKPGVEKRGGQYSGGQQTASWFSWMSEKYDEEAESAAHIFKMLGFWVEEDENGGITLTEYDSKIGQEDLFINEVKDLAVPGWSMLWRGEDGEVWRQTAEGTESGKVLFRSDVAPVLAKAYDAGTKARD